MPRVLAIAERDVAVAERPAYLGTLAPRRAAAAAAGAHFWVFEAVDAPGRVVEFTEGPSDAAVRSALGLAPGATPAAALWRELAGEP